MIEVEHLSKHYGRRCVIDDVSFTVPPGRITGLLGPNGAGKSTTLRMIVGLTRPGGGNAAVRGAPYRCWARPMTVVGAELEPRSAHPRRTLRAHLRALAQSNGLPAGRVDEVLDLVGLTARAGHRAGGLSLGMSQRLGIAAAMLGDPQVLILDEPMNGLDPEGLAWLRTMLAELAGRGRTVLVSSHLLNELAPVAEWFVILGRGRVLADASAVDLVARGSRSDLHVRVAGPRLHDAQRCLAAAGGIVDIEPGGELRVAGLPLERAATRLFDQGIPVYDLHVERASLEEVFLGLTRDAVEFTGNPA